MNKFFNKTEPKILVIGAGVAGSAVARVCADKGCHVEVFDKNAFVAGHCYDEYDKNGILIHKFGPHYFRTDDDRLLAWLSQFTEWVPGKYYVRAHVNGKLIPLPISLSTISALKGREYTKEEFEEYLKQNREDIPEPQNAEEQCLALVGKELYETFFKGYTLKQWGIHPKDLAASVTARIPLRFNHDERYPVEKHQVMPKEGYTKMFEKILNHPRIHLRLNTPLESGEIFSMSKRFDATVYTGPIDALFDYKYGKLQYRSLEFEWKYFDQEFVQPCVQINYPKDHEYTRTVEIKHVTGQDCKGTTVCYEYPKADGPPYYPLLTQKNKDIYTKYALHLKNLQEQPHPIYLIGRLAEFRYFNMDQVFLRSFKLARKILEKHT